MVALDDCSMALSVQVAKHRGHDMKKTYLTFLVT